MNGDRIDKLLRKVFVASKKYSKGATFLGVFPKDKLPANIPRDKPSLLVANTDDHGKPGQHWIAICFVPDRQLAEYFDSYGEPPLPQFAAYMAKRAKRVKRNRKQLQSMASMFCGHYVILFCAFRAIGYDVNRFSNIFTRDYGFNDLIVHHVACKMIVA